MPGIRRAAAVIAAIILVAAASVAVAHETWLLPSSMRIAVGRSVALNVTSGMAFPANETAIDPKRVVRAEVRMNGAVQRLPSPGPTQRALRYVWTPRQSGVAAISVALTPRTLELEPRLIEEYLAEIRADATVRAQWDSVAAPRRWRESYTKNAATFVRVGNPRDDLNWQAPLGLDLEIVPGRDPTALAVGDTLPIRVLLHNAPLAGFPVGVRREGAAATADKFVITNSAGRGAIVFHRSGRWLLFGTRLHRVHEPSLEWRSEFVTMTIAVLPGSAR